MEQRDLNRMFDALAPTQEQEKAVLDRLLHTERKGNPMKKLKKLTVLGIAAALMVISCAAAVVTGIDQRILEYFGADQEQAELLVPCALPVDITTEDNGAVFHVSQVLMDRYSLTLLADFTAPEGTVLDETKENLRFDMYAHQINQSGKRFTPYAGWSNLQTLLDDGDPLDNHLTVLYQMLPDLGFQPDDGLKSIELIVKHLARRHYEDDGRHNDPVFLGDWSCQIPFTWQDMGRSVSPNQVVGQLGGENVVLTEVYLSPMSLNIRLKHSHDSDLEQVFDCDNVVLTSGDGETVPITIVDRSSWYDRFYHLNKIIDPSQFQGGTLTLNIGGESIDVPLDGLVPAE